MSESLCSMPYLDLDLDDGDYCVSWEEKRVRARKEHRCCECGGVIRPGEIHGRAKGLTSGLGWSDWRRCPSCMALVEWVAMVLGGCPQWGLLESIIGEDDRATDAGIPTPFEYRRQWDAGREATP